MPRANKTKRAFLHGLEMGRSVERRQRSEEVAEKIVRLKARLASAEALLASAEARADRAEVALRRLLRHWRDT
jgi:hypothetical protein